MFAGSGSTARQAQFTCRVTLLANVNCPYLSQWAKVGPIAAGGLSDQAAAVTSELSGENAIHQQVQIAPGPGWSSSGPTSSSAPSGLIGNQLLTKTNTGKKNTNYSLRPVWLRLARKGPRWQSYTSLDRVRWTHAGPAVSRTGTGHGSAAVLPQCCPGAAPVGSGAAPPVAAGLFSETRGGA